MDAFDLAKVNRSPAFFDYEKLNWMNGEYIRRLPPEGFVDRLRPLARERYGERVDEGTPWPAPPPSARYGPPRWWRRSSRCGSCSWTRPTSPSAPSPSRSCRATERAAEILDAVAAHLEACEWTPDGVDLRPVLDTLGIKPRKGLPAVYTAVEGTHAGLPLFDSIVLLGRERALARVRAARGLLG